MIFVLIIGALPFILGGLQNWFMLRYMDFPLPYALIAVLFLLLWGVVAFFIKKFHRSTAKTLFFLNFIAAADMILVAIQELFIHSYWMGPLGKWSQLFYLPLLNLGVRFTTWSHNVFAAYAVSFLLMLAASFVGCRLRDRAKT